MKVYGKTVVVEVVPPNVEGWDENLVKARAARKAARRETIKKLIETDRVKLPSR